MSSGFSALHFELRARTLPFARTPNVSTKSPSKSNAYILSVDSAHTHIHIHTHTHTQIAVDSLAGRVYHWGTSTSTISKLSSWDACMVHSRNRFYGQLTKVHMHIAHAVHFGSSVRSILSLQIPSSAYSFAALTYSHISERKTSLWDRFIYFFILCRS